MGRINSKVVFLTTSPRTPEKMIPEISLLNQYFSGTKWDGKSQSAFMQILQQEDFFNGKGEKDPAFSARDRINRAPQTLGFVKLKPTISLTPQGENLISTKRWGDILLRQLIKFQLPSPFHPLSDRAAKFWVKPYLEIIRLIKYFGVLKFDELKMFALQLTDYRDFDIIVKKIERFRKDKAQNKGNYRRFVRNYFEKELRQIYESEIKAGLTKTRETADMSIAKFLKTKANNMRDYADACFRYLRATEMMSVSHIGKSLSIIPEKIADIDYILKNTDREPCHVDNLSDYISYLGNPDIPQLLIDNKSLLLNKFKINFPMVSVDETLSIHSLNEQYNNLVTERKQQTLNKETHDLKGYKHYENVQDLYSKILNNSVYDSPLMLEWNTWRAMTMLDGGEIKANLNFDDFGEPLSTAQGNKSDIVCDYGDFGLSVEVTMLSGQKQFESEAESVSRHLGSFKRIINKPAYCLFIAPTINKSTIAYFYMLHKTNIDFYGGKSIIVPLPIHIFQKMLEDSRRVDYIPSPKHVQQFFMYSGEVATKCNSENEWYEAIINKALNWLSFDK